MVIVYNFIIIVPIIAGATMARNILYLLLLAISIPLEGMEKGTLQVFLGAPEYWTADGKQCDLDEKGDLCPMGPREQLLELKYITAFPKLKAYLEKNENTLKGFDPKMFKLLQNCLGLSYIHQMTAESSDDQKGIEKEIEDLYVKEYSAGKVVDALYISRLAGLSLIEKLSIKAFKEKKNYRGRLIRLDEVYPSFESLDEIRPEESMSEDTTEDEITEQSSESASDSEFEESSESQSSSESESEEEINELPQFDFFFEPKNFSPEAFLRSLGKRFSQTKQKNSEESTQKNALVVAAPELWFLKVKSENEFIAQAAKRIKMLENRIEDARIAKAKPLTEKNEQKVAVKKVPQTA